MNPADEQAFIVDTLGDMPAPEGSPAAPGGLLAYWVPRLWEQYVSKANIPYLRALYVRRDAISLMKSTVWQEVTFNEEGAGFSLSDLVKNLNSMLTDVNAQILRIETTMVAGSGFASGELTTTTPTVPPTGIPMPHYPPDANDPYYRGNPYKWPWLR